MTPRPSQWYVSYIATTAKEPAVGAQQYAERSCAGKSYKSFDADTPDGIIHTTMTEYEQVVQIAEDVGTLLADAGATLVVAESCTGGLLGHLVTEIPGSSAYFKGGVITYSDGMKALLLGVRHETLVAHGAVSGAVAREMADGARTRLDSDYALSITGIAGPAGGTDEKPVGLTYIGIATPAETDVHEHIWSGTRSENKLSSARAALLLLREKVSAEESHV